MDQFMEGKYNQLLDSAKVRFSLWAVCFTVWVTCSYGLLKLAA